MLQILQQNSHILQLNATAPQFKPLLKTPLVVIISCSPTASATTERTVKVCSHHGDAREGNVMCSTCRKHYGKNPPKMRQQLTSTRSPVTILYDEAVSWPNTLSSCLRRETHGGTACRACHHLWSSAGKGPSPLSPHKWYSPSGRFTGS